MVMADLALLEDLANHALRREYVFKDRADLFNESTMISRQYRFLCHDFGEDVYVHMTKIKNILIILKSFIC